MQFRANTFELERYLKEVLKGHTKIITRVACLPQLHLSTAEEVLAHELD